MSQMDTDETELYDGKEITVWLEKENDEPTFTIRVGPTTINMPHAIFLELIEGLSVAKRKFEGDETLT